MANPIATPKIAFTRAARWAGLTDRELRNWLDRKQVTLERDEERDEGKHRRFTVIDVIRLAVIGRVSEYGWPIELAAKMTDDTVTPRLKTLARYRNTPLAALRAALHDLEMVVAITDDTVVVRTGHGKTGGADTSGLTDFVVIRVGKVADDVITRVEIAEAAGD